MVEADAVVAAVTALYVEGEGQYFAGAQRKLCQVVGRARFGHLLEAERGDLPQQVLHFALDLGRQRLAGLEHGHGDHALGLAAHQADRAGGVRLQVELAEHAADDLGGDAVVLGHQDVQAQIEQVKLDVDYIASDSSLTPSDKQQVANEWVRIQGEYWSIMANAEKYDVPTDSFTVYFQALEDYLTPLLADMSTTSEITGTEFRKVFSDYYEISSNMSDLIDDAIDESIKSTEYLKQAMEDGSTEVKGGLVMTNVMLMKNMQGEVTAGVSGLQEDDVPFWSGADYTNRKKAVFRVHADGEVHATKGTVGILQVKNDSVEVSDAAASGDKIILTPYRITSVSQVLGASSVPGVVETKEVSALAMGQSNPFIRNVYESSPPFTCGQGVQMSARITGRITGNAEGGGGGVKIEVVNALTGKADPLYRNSTAEAQNTNLNIDETISYLFTGAAQKYYIRITVEASAAGKLTASATMNAAQFNFVKDIRKNLIAPNGVAVVKGSSNYAVFTGDIFEVLIGKAGLRIQNGYVYKRDTDHTTWTKI